MLKLKRFIILSVILFITILIVGCDTKPTTSITTDFTTVTNSQTSTNPTTQAPITINSTTVFTTTENITTQLPTTILTTETPTTASTTLNSYIGIEVTEVRKTEYEYNEAFDPHSITVIIKRLSGQYLTLSPSMYTISGFDSSLEGEIEVTITFNDFQDSFYVTILPYEGFHITMPYYETAEGLVGDVLLEELRSIVNTGKKYVSYDAARYILDDSDADPNIPGNVILVYLGTSVSGTWDAGATWNREHVWPQSLLGYDTTMSADLHNLKPANPSENSSRGNRYFDNISVSNVSYEPRDEVKGDVARILFYMMTMYSSLTLVDTVPTTYQMALFSVLLEWHELDPVDDFERNRNEVIYSYQNNRNPYIDYPEFVDLIWG